MDAERRQVTGAKSVTDDVGDSARAKDVAQADVLGVHKQAVVTIGRDVGRDHNGISVRVQIVRNAIWNLYRKRSHQLRWIICK